MADNLTITPGAGATIATDDISSVHYQRVKLDVGVDGVSSPVTSVNPLPVSAASLPLPSGAATAAKQPALGTAGTPSADVISVQGVTSMTALKVDGSGVTQPVSGTVTANAGTNLNTSALALETGGNLATIKTNTDKIPALGQALAAASVPVVLPAIQAAALRPSSSTGSAPAQTAVGTDAGQILAANASRKRCIVQNTGLTKVKIAFGQTPTATAYHYCLAACSAADAGDGGGWMDDMWTGAVSAISSSAGGTVVVTEFT